ncbi:hypothetical protein [Klenkia terrae]|uniref:Uncharacterized protein n=1 Tax=Klenkia terrae TaxID=1052259 RepID=A0ABU8EEV1_9ACTN
MRLATVGKLLGVAGIAGVAATGVVLARDERERRAYTPDDVRARLHARAEAVASEPAPGEGSLEVVPEPTTPRGRLAQRASWQRRRFVDPVATAVGNQVARLRRRSSGSGEG